MNSAIARGISLPHTLKPPESDPFCLDTIIVVVFDFSAR
jgi:hypothetical protein